MSEVQEVQIQGRCEAFLGKMYEALVKELKARTVNAHADNIVGGYTIAAEDGDVVVSLTCLDAPNPPFYAEATIVAFKFLDVFTISEEADDPMLAMQELKMKAVDTIIEYANTLLDLTKAMATMAKSKGHVASLAALRANQVYTWRVLIDLQNLARLLGLFDVMGRLDKLMDELAKVDDMLLH